MKTTAMISWTIGLTCLQLCYPAASQLDPITQPLQTHEPSESATHRRSADEFLTAANLLDGDGSSPRRQKKHPFRRFHLHSKEARDLELQAEKAVKPSLKADKRDEFDHSHHATSTKPRATKMQPATVASDSKRHLEPKPHKSSGSHPGKDTQNHRVGIGKDVPGSDSQKAASLKDRAVSEDTVSTGSTKQTEQQLDELERAARNSSRIMWKIANAAINLITKDDGRLDVSEHILHRMGKCRRPHLYRLADSDQNSQCVQSRFHNFPPAPLESSYLPDKQVNEALANFAGLSIQDLEDFNLISDNQVHIEAKGRWCGKPASGKGLVSNEYWRKCVMPNAGYFNVLECDDAFSSVIGIAAINPGVCYAIHEQLNEEAHWQIAGNGTWRTWPSASGEADGMLKNAVAMSGQDFGIGKGHVHVHAAGLPREMETRDSEDDWILSVYWWAMDHSKVDVFDWKPINPNLQGTCGGKEQITKFRCQV